MESVDYEFFDPSGKYYFLGITTSNIIGGYTAYYNCHAYTWHLTEGNTNNVWINAGTNANNLSTYWSSNYGCFASGTESDAIKIHYYSGDHSAVKSTVTGKYDSKFGQWYVIRHDPNQVPYSSPSNRNYYVRRPFISGPSLICSSQSYTATNFLSGYTWGNSSNLSIPPGSGSTAIASKSYNGPGWVSIKVGTEELARKAVWVGPPVVSYIHGQTSVNYSTAQYIAKHPADYEDLFNPASGTANTTYQWSINPYAPLYYLSHTGDVDVNFSNSPAGYYELSCVATNSCGSSFTTTVGIQNGSRKSAAYPNPVSDILNVEMDQNQQTARNNLTYHDIRLYDAMGSQVRQTTTTGNSVQFNVSNLPDGVYYLHIYDDPNSRPEVQTVIVKH